MTVFVSYSRQDNFPLRLWEIESRLRGLGDLYMDDLHHPADVDRHFSVMGALLSADLFVAVLPKNFLRTPWTRFEVTLASAINLPLLKLSTDGKIVPTTSEDLLEDRMQAAAVAVVDRPPLAAAGRHKAMTTKP